MNSRFSAYIALSRPTVKVPGGAEAGAGRNIRDAVDFKILVPVMTPQHFAENRVLNFVDGGDLFQGRIFQQVAFPEHPIQADKNVL